MMTIDTNKHNSYERIAAPSGHDVIAEECDNPLPDIRIRELLLLGMCLTQAGTVSPHFAGLAQGPSPRLRQRDEGVPRRPGGPPHLGCCGSNYLSQAHTQLAVFRSATQLRGLATIEGFAG